MAEPFIGEVRIFSFNFPPKGWAFCNGQLLPINQNQTLYSILGTTYGGDGRTNFALPNLQGRTPVHTDPGNGMIIGQRGGEAAHTLTIPELPSHNHVPIGSSDAAAATSASDALWAAEGTNTPYSQSNNVAMASQCLAAAGGSQAHENLSPYLTLNFCIALQGIFPSRN